MLWLTENTLSPFSFQTYETYYLMPVTLHTVKTRRLGDAVPALGVKPYRGWYVLRLFFNIGICSAISFERSRREVSIDVVEHRSTSKNDKNTIYLRLSFIPKIGIAFPKTGVCFDCNAHYV